MTGPGRPRIYQWPPGRPEAPAGLGAADAARREKNVRGRWRDAASARIPRRDEADLSAQEAQARTHARVPPAHADEGRPADAQAPPRQGPQAPHRLTPDVAPDSWARPSRL